MGPPSSSFSLEDDVQNRRYVLEPEERDTASRGRKVFEEIIVCLKAFVNG